MSSYSSAVHEEAPLRGRSPEDNLFSGFGSVAGRIPAQPKAAPLLWGGVLLHPVCLQYVDCSCPDTPVRQRRLGQPNIGKRQCPFSALPGCLH